MTSTQPLACETRNVTVAYEDEPVLRSVNFRVPQGVVMGVVVQRSREDHPAQLVNRSHYPSFWLS